MSSRQKGVVARGIGWGRIASAVGLLLLAGTAAAEDPSLIGELIDSLCESGDLTPDRCRELRARAAAEAEAGAEPSAEDPTGWRTTWRNNFRVERNDGLHQLRFGGRIQLDWAALALSPSLEDTIGGDGYGIEFRRARMFTDGLLYRRLFFKFQFGFEDAELSFQDVYMGLLFPSIRTSVLVGHAYEPFSLEQLESSKYTTFMERALPTILAPSRNTGIRIRHFPANERTTFDAGFYLNTDNSGEFLSDGSRDSENFDLTARVTGLPLYGPAGRRIVHVGLAYAHQFRNPRSPVRYAQRPESHLAPQLVDTLLLPADNVDLLGVEFAWVHESFLLQSEAMASWVDRVDAPRTAFWGATAEISYFLTGEHRIYDREFAVFDRVSPTHDFNPGAGGWGAWQVAARYSYLDLSDRDVRGGRLHDMTLGINWYLYANARIVTNYVYAKRKPSGHANLFQMRFEINF
ncbi:MAG: porin [Proteobacteria bacterium]|nr:porin [Pseudomonadota bacterium]